MNLLLIQNCPTEGFGRYETCLEAEGAAVTVVAAYDGASLEPLGDFDGVIVGGTPVSAWEAEAHEFLSKECDYLRRVLESGNPCLGICCGAQLLALLLGAEVRRSPRPEIGTYTVSVTEDGRHDGILDGFPSAFPVFHWHADTFDVPAGAKLLVRGEDCPNQMFRHGNAIGVQFHLEIGAGDARRWSGVYADELRSFGQSSARICEECLEREADMHVLAERLIRSFMALVRRQGTG